MYVKILILFIFLLFVYDSYENLYSMYYSSNFIEGLNNMEENDGNTNLQTIIYKNQGAIENLQDELREITNSMNKTIHTNANQDASLKSLSNNIKILSQELNTKIDSTLKLANEANELSKKNKNSLLNIVNERKQKVNDVRNKMAKIPPIRR